MTSVAALAFAATFTSCSKSDDLYNANQQNEDMAKAYQTAFVERFGQPAANHTWGFETTASTRATTRAWNDGQPCSDPNGTEWARTDDAYKAQYNFKVPAVLTAAQKDKVRRYFQQHQNPGGTDCEAMSDYFIQHVYTGASNVTSDSQTSETYYRGDNTTPLRGSANMDRYVCGSAHTHLNNFNATDATGIDVWDGVSYQEGWPKADQQYVENYNHKKTHKDKIMMMRNSDTNSFGWFQSNGSIEINDHYTLVSGDDIQNWDNTTTVNGESADVSGMMFIGFDFEGNNAVATRTYDNNNGKYYWGGNANMASFREATASDPEESKAYFRNYYGPNDKQYVLGCADGYYSDWIVRLIKAEKNKEIKEEGRIICEDLGTSDDFDFNDIVFDATIYTDNTCDITILSAGGTLDVTVAGEDIHAHTGKMTTKCNYSFSTSGYSRLIDIPIVVTTTNSAGEITSYDLHCEKGAAPQKICVGKDYKWCTERTHIDDAYPGFKTWVKQNNNMDWTKSPVSNLVVQ